MSTGTILAVHPLGVNEDDALGYMQVTEVRLTESTVVPVAYGKHGKPTAAEDLPESARGRVVRWEFGSARLRVALQRQPNEDDGELVSVDPIDSKERLGTLADTLQRTCRQWVEFVPAGADANWIIRDMPHRGALVLMPAEGLPMLQLVPSYPSRTDGEIAALAEDRLRQLYRYENLRKLARDPVFRSARNSPSHLDLNFRRVDGTPVGRNAIPAEVNGSMLTPVDVLRPGEQVVIEIRNTGRVPLDVTVLALDANLGIQCVFPRHGASPRFNPNDHHSIGPLDVSDEVTGVERLIALCEPARPLNKGGISADSLHRPLRHSRARRASELIRSADCWRHRHLALKRVVPAALTSRNTMRALARRSSG